MKNAYKDSTCYGKSGMGKILNDKHCINKQYKCLLIKGYLNMINHLIEL